MDGQLLACYVAPCLGRPLVSEEELQQPGVPELCRLPGWTLEPRTEGVASVTGDREEPPPPPFLLTLFGQESEFHQARRLLVQEGMREGPEIADRRCHVALQVVWRRRTFPRKETQHEIGRRA